MARHAPRARRSCRGDAERVVQAKRSVSWRCRVPDSRTHPINWLRIDRWHSAAPSTLVGATSVRSEWCPGVLTQAGGRFSATAAAPPQGGLNFHSSLQRARAAQHAGLRGCSLACDTGRAIPCARVLVSQRAVAAPAAWWQPVLGYGSSTGSTGSICKHAPYAYGSMVHLRCTIILAAPRSVQTTCAVLETRRLNSGGALGDHPLPQGRGAHTRVWCVHAGEISVEWLPCASRAAVSTDHSGSPPGHPPPAARSCAEPGPLASGATGCTCQGECPQRSPVCSPGDAHAPH